MCTAWYKDWPPFAVQTMLLIHFVQHLVTLSDQAMEEVFHDVPLFRCQRFSMGVVLTHTQRGRLGDNYAGDVSGGELHQKARSFSSRIRYCP